MTRSKLFLSFLLVGVLAAAGCDDDGDPEDAGPGMDDAGPGMDDAGPDDDAGPGEDPDAGMNLPPVGAITAPLPGITISEGESITFASTCMDPENGAVTHAWDFGGGAAASTEAQPGAVQFDTAGAYTVTYTCTDDQGQDSSPATVMVAVNGGTMASIDAPATDAIIAVGETVDFEGSCNDPEMSPTITHFWDFAGGATNVTVEDPGAVQFDTAGTFIVTYTCFDNEGGRGSAMITVTVNTPPVGTIDSPTGALVTVAPGGAADFQASCTDADGDVTLTHAWDFGGGATASTMEDPGMVTFASPGTYVVTYTCTDSLGYDDPAPPTVIVNVATPTRFVAYTGDVLADAVTQVVLTDISGATPGAPIDPISGGWPAFADMPSTTAIQYSPDGRYLAFVADATTDNDDDLYVVDLTVATPVAVNLSSVPAGSDVEQFEWAPDSQKIAYTADVTTIGEDELYVVDFTTGLGSAVTTRAHGALPAGGDVFPTFWTTVNDDFAWSASSTKVFFRGEVLTDSVIEAFVFDLTNVAAGAVRLHAAGVTGADVSSVYAAGEIAVFIADLDVDGANDVYATDTSVAGPYTAARLTTATSTTEAIVSTTSNFVSPDGTRFVFEADLGTDGADELWGVDFSGGVTAGSAVRLSQSFSSSVNDVTRTQWDPTSNRVIYRADVTSTVDELFLVDWTAATPAAPVLINAPTSEDIDNFYWAPDGSGVAFAGDLDTNAMEELYYVALPAGGAPGAQVKLNQPLGASNDVDDDVIWVTPTLLVFEADPGVTDQEELFVVDIGMPGVATRLNSPIAGTSTTTDYDIIGAGLTTDGLRIVARADPEESSTAQAYIMDPFAPGTSTLLHPTLVGTTQDVSYIAGEI